MCACRPPQSPSTVGAGDFDKIGGGGGGTQKRTLHFTSLSHTHTHTHARAQCGLTRRRAGNTRRTLPSWRQRLFTTASRRVRAPRSQTVVGNLHLPGAGIEPACAVERARRRPRSSQKKEHYRRLDLCKKKEKRKPTERDSRAEPRLPPRQPLRRRGVRPKRTNLRVERLSLNRSQ